MEQTKQQVNCPYCNVSFTSAKQCGCHKRACKLNPNYENIIRSRRLGAYNSHKVQKLHNSGFFRKASKMTYSVICERCGNQFTLTATEYQFNKKLHFYCSRSCANARQHTQNTRQKISKSLCELHGHKAPDKFCVRCGKKLCIQNTSGYCRNCIYYSVDFRSKLSAGLRRSGKAGGYRVNSSWGHHGWYKGYHCDSSWELAYVIYNLDHGISFARNYEKFKYKYQGKWHNYLPDFVVDTNYIEIKGRWTDKWQAKLDQFPYPDRLVVLTRKDMKPYIDYTISTYGSDFVRLYENSQPNIDYSKQHWYTDIITGKHTVATRRLEYPWVYGRIDITKTTSNMEV